jgi:hypothetical protein
MATYLQHIRKLPIKLVLLILEVTSLETKKKLYENTRAGILQEKQSLSELKGSFI